MSGTARSRSQFLSQVRASFSQPPATTPSESVHEIADQVLAAEMQPTELSAATETVAPEPVAAPMIPPPVVPQSTAQLDVLDKAITEVEENVVHRAQVVTPKLQVPVEVLPEPVAQPTAVPEPTMAAPSQPVFDSLASALPTAIDQSTQTLNPNQPTTNRVKEVGPVTAVPEQPQVSMVESSAASAPVEVSGNASGYYESGPVTPEIPVEIEAYLQEVKNHQDQLPHEIVVNNDDITLQPTAPALRPVVVLPITPEIEKQGARKSPAMSIRWLVEWSRRLMKMFTGKIIYQQS